jgi:hypothetical protein
MKREVELNVSSIKASCGVDAELSDEGIAEDHHFHDIQSLHFRRHIN